MLPLLIQEEEYLRVETERREGHETVRAWRVLVCSILLNQTRGAKVRGVRDELFGTFPTPESMRGHHQPQIEKIIAPLGIQRRRSATLVRFSEFYTRFGGLNQYVTNSLHDAVEEMALPGVGEYARDAWRIFVMNRCDRTGLLDGSWPTDGWLRLLVEESGSMYHGDPDSHLALFLGSRLAMPEKW